MLDIINDSLWVVVILLIVGLGLYFSIKLKFTHFNIFKIFKYLFKEGESGGISPLQTLTMNLAARIGVGSISGIALAIYIGGPGTIFWMWISAIIASSLTFFESTLAVKYQERDEKGIYKGGPSYYINKGLKKKNLAKFYSLLIIMAYVIGFMTIQSNTITIGITEKLNINPWIIGIIVAVITGLIIIKGVKSIANATNFLVPIVSIVYIIVCILIISMNISAIPGIFKSIFVTAFNSKSIGAGVISTLIIGIQRGIFSNEAGIGSGAIAAATVKTEEPRSQGYIQSFGIYFDTLVISTLSALVILCSNYASLNIIDANGIEIAKYAFSSQLGEFGNWMLIIVIFLLALSTIITGYYYGESSFKFLLNNPSKFEINILKIFTLLLLIFGSVMSSSFIWNIIDIFVGFLAIINIYALWKLRKEI